MSDDENHPEQYGPLFTSQEAEEFRKHRDAIADALWTDLIRFVNVVNHFLAGVLGDDE